MKTFRVYINQVNQTYYDVKARTKEAAESKACKEWKAENGPRIMSIAVMNKEAA